MNLPSAPLPTDVVVVAGAEVKVRGLSRAEAIRLRDIGGDMDLAENHILACGAGVSEEEAADWRDAVLPEVAGAVIDRICELSGLVEGAQKSV